MYPGWYLPTRAPPRRRHAPDAALRRARRHASPKLYEAFSGAGPSQDGRAATRTGQRASDKNWSKGGGGAPVVLGRAHFEAPAREVLRDADLDLRERVAAHRLRARGRARERGSLRDSFVTPPPPPSRTNWTRLVPPPVLIGRMAGISRSRTQRRGALSAGARPGQMAPSAPGRPPGGGAPGPRPQSTRAAWRGRPARRRGAGEAGGRARAARLRTRARASRTRSSRPSARTDPQPRTASRPAPCTALKETPTALRTARRRGGRGVGPRCAG